MGVSVTAVQQVVDVVRMVRVVWWEGVRVLIGNGQLTVVAEVIQILVVLLYGSGGGEAGTGAVMLPYGGRRKWRNIKEKSKGGFRGRGNGTRSGLKELSNRRRDAFKAPDVAPYVTRCAPALACTVSANRHNIFI